MNLVEEIAPNLDGLAQLQALLASGRKPGILASLNFDFVFCDSGLHDARTEGRISQTDHTQHWPAPRRRSPAVIRPACRLCRSDARRLQRSPLRFRYFDFVDLHT